MSGIMLCFAGRQRLTYPPAKTIVHGLLVLMT